MRRAAPASDRPGPLPSMAAWLLGEIAVVIADVVKRHASRGGRAGRGAALRCQQYVGSVDDDADIAAAMLERARPATLLQLAVLVADALQRQRGRIGTAVLLEAHGFDRGVLARISELDFRARERESALGKGRAYGGCQQAAGEQMARHRFLQWFMWFMTPT